MRAFVLGVLFLSGFMPHAMAQLTYGPTAIKTKVNGVPITIHATSSVRVNAVDDKLMVNVRILADLIDLQKHLASIIATFAPPANQCANRRGSDKSPVVTFKSGSLWPRGNQIVMFMRGQIDVWSCRLGRQHRTIRWRRKKIAFIKMPIPQLRVWRQLIKRQDGTQTFRGSLPIYLTKNNNESISLQTAAPTLRLQGEDGILTDATLQSTKAAINRTVASALQQAVDPATLKDVLPTGLQKLNMDVVSARFRSLGGHVMAEIKLGGSVTGETRRQLLQMVAARVVN